jgi:hypothetical protein
VKERPILFRGEMARAILDGRKVQTRRIVKPQPEDAGFGRNAVVCPYRTGTQWPLAYYEMRGSCWNSSDPLRCPYGQPGDRLWVRETWMPYEQVPSRAIYRADDVASHIDKGWSPSIHMPRWASRITLDIVSVRAERLWSISRGDAIAEGCPRRRDTGGTSPVVWFHELWESINGQGSWSANPWVWVIEFKRWEAK